MKRVSLTQKEDAGVRAKGRGTELSEAQLEEIRKNLVNHGKDMGLSPSTAKKSAQIFVDAFAGRLEE